MCVHIFTQEQVNTGTVDVIHPITFCIQENKYLSNTTLVY
jgi:hypothetical protein